MNSFPFTSLEYVLVFFREVCCFFFHVFFVKIFFTEDNK